MYSLEHYFSPSIVSRKADLPKEPLQDVSENTKQDSDSSRQVISNVKAAKRRKAKSKKPGGSINGEIEKTVNTNEGDAKKSDFGENGQPSQQVEPQKDSQSVENITPPSSKPNAFQLLMSQKKKKSPVGEDEKKRLNFSLKSAKKTKPEEGEKLVSENDKDAKNESATENGRKSRRTKETPKLLLDDDSDDLFESSVSKSSGKSKTRSKRQAKKTSEVAALKSRKNKSGKRKKIISSDDEEVENSPVPKVTDKKKKAVEKNKSDAAEAMEVDAQEGVEETVEPKQPAPQMQSEVKDAKEEQSISKKSSKRKRKTTSSDEETKPATPDIVAKVAKRSIFGYFTPISKDEALKRAAKAMEAPKVQTIQADVHPEPVDSQKRRSMGPRGRAVRSTSPREQESIEVLEVTYESAEGTLESPKKPSPMKVKKNKNKKPFQLRVKLLSPVKSISEASCHSSSSDSDDSDSEIEIEIPVKRQINKTNGWGAGGKLAPIFLPRNRKAAAATASKKIFQHAPLPQIRAAPTEHTIGFADEDPEAPTAALFPSISHVGEHISVFSDTDESIKQLLDRMSHGNVENIVPSSFDLGPISKANAFNTLKPAKKKASAGPVESWCEKYKPKLSVSVAGNESTVHRLRSWLERWTENKGTKDVAPDSGSDLDSLDDFIVSDDDEGSNADKRKKKKKPSNTVLLVGPSGSGKTAAVYAIAEELGFKVLEVNASSKRSGKRILSKLREATQSHQVRSGAVDQESIASFFGKGQGGHASNSQQQSNQSLSLILVEDVDVVFEEQDEGFLTALNTLSENSKRPIVLISNDQNCSVVLNRQHHTPFGFDKVPINKSADILEDICDLEGIPADREFIKTLLVNNGGDLRSSLHSAQLLSLSGGFPKTVEDSLKFPLDFEELILRMQTKPKPFIISENDLEDSHAEDSPKKLNDSWCDSDSDNTLFKSRRRLKTAKRKPRIDSEGSVEDNVDVDKVTASISDLEKMSRFADCVAVLDTLQGIGCGHMKSKILPGLSDRQGMEAVPNGVGPQVQHVIATKALKHYQVTNLGTEHWESNQKWYKSHETVRKSLTEQLNKPIVLQEVSLDYLPILRELGRSEQSSARSSRRSAINCLQSIGMQPDQFVLEALPFVLTK
ncbi:enhanced level of genomic instability 1 [Cloeon dipterum]|uniref:enhanced level of genomic instability 1 n=1 Tax=Cloeon dipterum TaxID=197152 RepID=UPI0032205E93